MNRPVRRILRIRSLAAAGASGSSMSLGRHLIKCQFEHGAPPRFLRQKPGATAYRTGGRYGDRQTNEYPARGLAAVRTGDECRARYGAVRGPSNGTSLTQASTGEGMRSDSSQNHGPRPRCWCRAGVHWTPRARGPKKVPRHDRVPVRKTPSLAIRGSAHSRPITSRAGNTQRRIHLSLACRSPGASRPFARPACLLRWSAFASAVPAGRDLDAAGEESCIRL